MATQKQNFIDRQVRPTVELLESLSHWITIVRTQRDALDPALAVDATAYDDGRPDENLDQVTEGQISNVLDALETFQDNTLTPNALLLRKIAVRHPME